MSARHVITVAWMHARDLSRRRLALTILLALPLVFYASGRSQVTGADATADDMLWVLISGAMGTNWSVAVAALFVVNGSRRADQPLLLGGYRGAELLGGRVLTVLALAAVVAPGYALLIGSQQQVDVGLLTLGIGLGCVVSVATGVLAAALVPRDMEGVLVIIGLVGIQMTVLEPWMPLWGSGELIVRAGGVAGGASVAVAVTHAVLATAVLMGAGAALWVRRTRLRAPSRWLTIPYAPATGAGLTDRSTS